MATICFLIRSFFQNFRFSLAKGLPNILRSFIGFHGKSFALLHKSGFAYNFGKVKQELAEYVEMKDMGELHHSNSK